MVHLNGVEAPGVFLSDNFFDLMPGESKTVEIRSDHEIHAADIQVRHWLHRWDCARPTDASRRHRTARPPVPDVRRILDAQAPDCAPAPKAHRQGR